MKTLALALCLCAIPDLAHALKLQILHTNDLHSYFDGTRTNKGGYARLKTLIEDLKAKAHAQGIATLFVDGGDFGEGTSYFMTDEGVESLRMLDALGIDVAVLGNHDHMHGGEVLAQQIKRAQLKTKIVSANLEGKSFLSLKGLVHDMVQVQIEGVKIGIFGLSTSDIHYQYPLLGKGVILPPVTRIKPMEAQAQKKKVDFLIALTHIGLDRDYEVVKKSQSIDLVVGGHSHTRLQQPRLVKNSKGRTIPIVQTGANSVALGEMILDIDPNTKQHQLLSYKLHDVTAEIARDPQVQERVHYAQELREQYLGRPFDEVIGESLIPLSGSVDGQSPTKTSCWGEHIATAIREAVSSEIGLHIAAFEGEQIPAGIIRFGDIVDNFPHFRKFGDQGWTIATLKIKGNLLKKAFDLIDSHPQKMGISFAGISRDPSSRKILINGEVLKSSRKYQLALPSEVPYAFEKIIPWLKRLFYSQRVYTTARYWNVMENYLKAHQPLECLTAQN